MRMLVAEFGGIGPELLSVCRSGHEQERVGQAFGQGKHA